MSLVLKNLQSNQQIRLDNDNPFVIGRSNVEGCSDKRVSRNHGRLTCTSDGKIHIVALHTNPCFYTRNGVPPILQINKDEEETLCEGDYLGLLPNEFWFKITSEKNEKKTDCIFNDEKSNSCLSENVDKEESKVKKPQPECSLVSVSNAINESSNRTLENQKLSISVDLESTRRLPLWMYEIDEPSKQKSPLKRVLSNHKDLNNKKIKITNDKSNAKPLDIPDIKVEDVNAPSTSKSSESTNLSDKSPKKNSESPTAVSSKVKNEKEGYESDVQIESPQKITKRPLCHYEGNCYRKNPQHKLDFSHPGDEDFVPYENRPLCQYGAACYRTNKMHKIEYRHPPRSSNPTSPSSASSRAPSPLPAKRRRKTVKNQGSDVDDEDEYDLDDPFINDGSSDEYLPSDVEEELDTSFQDD